MVVEAAGMDAGQFEQIRYDIRDGVATITLHRPERLNAFTEQMSRELVDAFDRADADDEVRVVVLTGAGRGFCAGADLGSGGATFDHPEGATHRDRGGQVSMRIFESLKPVIAAFNGPAVGIGVTMTLPADVRLAATTATSGFVFARRGIVPEAA
jgi:enoyl-CoA hydratase/carnithine racemase